MTYYRAVGVVINGEADTAYINPGFIIAVDGVEGHSPFIYRRVYLLGGNQLPVLNTRANIEVIFEGKVPEGLTCD